LERLKFWTTVFMYALGDCRSVTLLPCARRSRSRSLILSRSKATAFMRIDSVSRANSGIASVSTVAPAAIAANTMVRNCASMNCSIVRSMTRPKSRN
jgi:hypothetical protein